MKPEYLWDKEKTWKRKIDSDNSKRVGSKDWLIETLKSHFWEHINNAVDVQVVVLKII